MPIHCTDLRAHSEELARDGASEVEIRTSISRAYYACFHSLMPFVLRLPASAQNSQGNRLSHHEMTSRISEWKIAEVCPELADKKVIKAQIQKALDTARMSRVIADYRLADDVTLSEAKMQIERVRLIMRMVAQIDEMLSDRSEGPVTA